MKISAKRIAAISGSILGASVFACSLQLYSGSANIFKFFWWIHIAVIVLGGLAIFRIRKIKSTWSEVLAAFRPLPLWLIAVSALVIVMAALLSQGLNFDLGNMPDGSPVQSANWYEKDGRYWLSLNKQTVTEITKVKYEKLQEKLYSFFTLSWLAFSYLILLQWYYIWRRESCSNQPPNLSLNRDGHKPAAL